MVEMLKYMILIFILSITRIDRIDRKTDIPVTKEIQIGNHSFIGAHSIILKGVTIGEKLMIGAGSVGDKSVPDGEIWGVNPAKIIKRIK